MAVLVAAYPFLPSIEAIRAVSSPQTKAPAPFLDMNLEVKPGIEDILTQQAHRFGLFYCYTQTFDSERIFCAHVDITLISANYLTTDCHAFQYFMWISL